MSRGLPVLAFLALLTVALSFGVRTTRDVEWPTPMPGGLTVDLYRDMSSAQTMLDSGYGPDPNFVGERSWYNPLVPAIMALTTAVTALPLNVVAVRLGTYANLLAPLTFFLMCAVLFDRWTALFASFASLFLLPDAFPAYLVATYFPCVLPVNFVLACFYLSIVALHWAYRDNRLAAFVVPGLLWGLTFLGHTAPALILGGVTVGWMFVAVR